MFSFIIVAVLITGTGNGFGLNQKSAELFLPLSGTSCTLPLLPNTRTSHTVDNHILCGGDYISGVRDSCRKWSPVTGSWDDLLTLDLWRERHVSWTPGNGTYLMGGAGSGMTTTLGMSDGTQEPGFPLKYDTE